MEVFIVISWIRFSYFVSYIFQVFFYIALAFQDVFEAFNLVLSFAESIGQNGNCWNVTGIIGGCYRSRTQTSTDS